VPENLLPSLPFHPRSSVRTIYIFLTFGRLSLFPVSFVQFTAFSPRVASYPILSADNVIARRATFYYESNIFFSSFYCMENTLFPFDSSSRFGCNGRGHTVAHIFNFILAVANMVFILRSFPTAACACRLTRWYLQVVPATGRVSNGFVLCIRTNSLVASRPVASIIEQSKSISLVVVDRSILRGFYFRIWTLFFLFLRIYYTRS
jgi:hypothetical protein